MVVRILRMVVILLGAFPCMVLASQLNQARLLGVDVETINPAKGEVVMFRYLVTQPGTVTLDIYTPEKTFLKKIGTKKHNESGEYFMRWDGTDRYGNVVPDAAWFPKLNWRSGQQHVSDFPALYSGGEASMGFQPKRTSTGVVFDLDTPSRVLVRHGLQDGPLMGHLAYWQPFPSGKVALRWDGLDQDRVTNMTERADFWLMGMSYSLPRFSVITRGNKKASWFTYRQEHDLKAARPNLEDISFRRNGMRIEKDYYYPRELPPELTLDIIPTSEGEASASNTGHNLVTNHISFQLSMPGEPEWLFDNYFYEIVVFVDGEFVYEEEQGFLPFNGQVDTTNLSMGEHFLTLQIVSMSGPGVVSKSIPFIKYTAN
ncbi:hypothetical protein ACPV50_06110 [Vibrio astriarenae]